MTRFYVTITWEDWPDGGSYGDIIEAENANEAEAKCRQAMADTRADEDQSAEEVMEDYGASWHVVDCFDLDEFIERNKRP